MRPANTYRASRRSQARELRILWETIQLRRVNISKNQTVLMRQPPSVVQDLERQPAPER